MSRLLSHSEISTAMECQARHAFAYTGHLTGGDALKPRTLAPRLSEGRAWGRAVATLHTPTLFPQVEALNALHQSLDEDAREQAEWGVYDPVAREAMEARLESMLLHYAETTEPLEVVRLERELVLPIPSRGGVRASSRYRFQCFIDGWTESFMGIGPWLVEYKLRDSLWPVWQIELSRQLRWYAWAWSRTTGRQPVGVIVDERLNAEPKQPRLVSDRRGGRVPSHAQDQVTTVEAYAALCAQHGVEPEGQVVAALQQRRWQQRVPIQFRQGELDEAAAELISSAKLIRDLDSGELFPVRNARPAVCRGCRYREICPTPDDALVDALFERRPPKRLRSLTHEEESHAVTTATSDRQAA